MRLHRPRETFDIELIEYRLREKSTGIHTVRPLCIAVILNISLPLLSLCARVGESPTFA